MAVAAAALTAVLVAVAAVVMVVMAVVVIVVMLMAVAMVMVVMMMLVVVMHNKISFAFNIIFLNYTRTRPQSQNIYFSGYIPPPGLRPGCKCCIMGKQMAPTQRKMHFRASPSFSTFHFTSEREEPPMAQHNHEHAHYHAHGTAHSHGHIHENQKAVVNRLARALGHLEKVKRMVEEGHDCAEVLVQLAAVRSALDNTGKVILQDHLRHCMVDAVAAGDQAAIDDLCSAIDKFMK